MNDKKGFSISDETIRDVAHYRRKSEYAEYYEAIENALVSLAENLWMASEGEDTKITLDLTDRQITCVLLYPDSDRREWQEEIEWRLK